MTATAGTVIDIVPIATTGATIGVPNAPSATTVDGPPGTTGGAARAVGTTGVEGPPPMWGGTATAMGMASSGGLQGANGRAVNAMVTIGVERTGSNVRSGSLAIRLHAHWKTGPRPQCTGQPKSRPWVKCRHNPL